MVGQKFIWYEFSVLSTVLPPQDGILFIIPTGIRRTVGETKPRLPLQLSEHKTFQGDMSKFMLPLILLH